MYSSFFNYLGSLAVLIFLDVLTETAIITSLGASAFIVFTMPHKYSSSPRRLLGGYSIGLIVGFIFYLLYTFYPESILYFLDEQTALVILAALSVGFSIFIMAVTNTEHAPAAGIALGLVINQWNPLTIVFIVGAIIWMASIKRILKPFLMNLT